MSVDRIARHLPIPELEPNDVIDFFISQYFQRPGVFVFYITSTIITVGVGKGSFTLSFTTWRSDGTKKFKYTIPKEFERHVAGFILTLLFTSNFVYYEDFETKEIVVSPVFKEIRKRYNITIFDNKINKNQTDNIQENQTNEPLPDPEEELPF